MKRLAILLPALLALQVGVQPALAWTWPVDGPVLQTFYVDANPYAGGQHRGIDVGAPVGTAVLAPTAGKAVSRARWRRTARLSPSRPPTGSP
jgi:murein DD-endopeptidase MepM/ murein hydrolase activator NlpD